MSDHGWDGDAGDWPDDLGPDFGEPETADLGGGGLDGGLDPGFEHDDPLDAPDSLGGDSLGGDDPLVEQAPLSDSSDLSDPVEVPDAPADAPAEGAGATTPVGADPDLDAHADTWTEQAFPDPLDLPAPEPVDGFPWTDPTTLGQAPLPDPDAAYQGAPEPTELAAYAGEEIPPGAEPWTALSGSEDPATSTLARWWSPEP